MTDMLDDELRCAECGELVEPDPAGSPGVFVHQSSDYVDGYDLDADHVPVPEEFEED